MHRLILFVFLAPALGAQSGANVLVIVNESSETSRKIAEYYAKRRSVPAGNICRLRTTTDEEIGREVYEKDIARPVADLLKAGKLREKILYIVTTMGVPLKISGSSGMDGDAAAVDSELTLLHMRLEGREPPTRGPLSNPFYRQRYASFRHPQFSIYLVTRLAGYDLGDVRGLIDRSIAAANRGKFVLDLNSPGDQDGNNWLRTAAILLPADRVVLDESEKVLYNQRGVIGYGSWGSNDPGRKRRWLSFEWLPGAIVTEYVSSNGRTFRRPPDNWMFTTWEDKKNYFAGSPQGLTADYIREGATGASGHVYEPYLHFSPRPDYLFPAYYSGRNLAESYYISIPALSWMNIVVGDPLCSIGKPR